MKESLLSDILTNKKLKENSKIAFVDIIVQKIENRAKLMKKMSINQFYYDIPNFIPGLPLYNPVEIAKIVVSKLKYTSIVEENVIWIKLPRQEKKTPHIPILLQRIKQKIKSVPASETFFEIPQFLPGYPLYDPVETAVVVSRYFDKEGFVVKTSGNIIYISWDVEQIENKNNMKIVFKTEEENNKKRQKKINLINLKKFKKFENNAERIAFPKQTIQKQPIHNGSIPFNNFPKLNNSKAYRNNTRTIYPVEYTDPYRAPGGVVKKLRNKKLETYIPIKKSNIDNIVNDLEHLKKTIKEIKR